MNDSGPRRRRFFAPLRAGGRALGLLAVIAAIAGGGSAAALAQSTGPQPYRIVPIDTAPADEPSPDASANPGYTTDAKPIDPADQKNVDLARRIFSQIQSGAIDRALLTPAFSATLTDAIVAQSARDLAPYGAPAAFQPSGKFDRDGTSAYVFRVAWPQGAVLYQLSVDDATGLVAGYFTRPAPPANRRR